MMCVQRIERLRSDLNIRANLSNPDQNAGFSGTLTQSNVTVKSTFHVIRSWCMVIVTGFALYNDLILLCILPTISTGSFCVRFGRSKTFPLAVPW